MRKAVLIAAFLSIGAQAAQGIDRKVNIIDDPAAPLIIINAVMTYDRYPTTDLALCYDVTNTSTKTVVAARVAGIIFDYFDRYLRTVASDDTQDIRPAETLKRFAGWPMYKFYRYESAYTAFLYVEAVRFEDGTVWEANDTFILGEVKRIYAGEYAEDILKPSKE